jgi:hypothetical protein
VLAWTSDALRSSLERLVPDDDIIAVASVDELTRERKGSTVAILDARALESLGTQRPPMPVVLVWDDELPAAIACLGAHPWLAHVLHASTLEQSLAADHLRKLLRTIVAEDPPRLLDWIPASFTARRVQLAQASSRAARLERMSEFYASHGTHERTISVITDVTEELLTNAFYDAPVAAGIVRDAIPRTLDVRLPDNHPCDLVYGCGDDLAIVHVGDPFGALSRQRVVDTLVRCARTDGQVDVDESGGGAGLGLWRIVSQASFVAISVVEHRATEILVGAWKRRAKARPFGFHWFFARDAQRSPTWSVDDASDRRSVTLAIPPESP